VTKEDYEDLVARLEAVEKDVAWLKACNAEQFDVVEALQAAESERPWKS